MHLPRSIWIQQIILALIVFVATWLCPFPELSIAVDTKWILISILILLLAIPQHFTGGSKRAIQLTEWLIIALFVWHLCSYFWAFRPYAIWEIAYKWGLIALFYISLNRLSFTAFSSTFWTRYILAILLVLQANVLLLFVVYLAKDGLQYLDLLKVGNYMGVNGNYLAGLLLITLPGYWFIAKQNVANWLWMLALLLQLILLLSFNSKAVLVALLIAAIYVVFKKGWAIRKLVLGSLLAIPAILLIGYVSFDDFATFLRAYNPADQLIYNTKDDRLFLWSRSLSLLSERPLHGWGAGNWFIVYPKDGLADASFAYNSFQYPKHAHNFFLQLSSEVGLGGLLLILSFLGLSIRKSLGKKDATPALLSTIFFIILCCFYGFAYPQGSVLFVPLFVFLFFVRIPAVKVSASPWIPHLIVGILCSVCTLYLYSQLTSLQFEKRELAFKKARDWDGAATLLGEFYTPKIRAVLDHRSLAARKSLYEERLNNDETSWLLSATVDLPYDAAILARMAKKYARQGLHRKALFYFDKALHITPKHFATNIEAAQIAYLLGKKKKARQYLSFYESDILYRRNTFFGDEAFDSDNVLVRRHLNRLCEYEDAVLALRALYESHN